MPRLNISREAVSGVNAPRRADEDSAGAAEGKRAMFQFFVEPSQVRDGEILIWGSDVNHIKNALRMKAGEQARVSDGEGNDYLCEIRSLDSSAVTLRILGRCAGTELPVRAVLFQCLPKGDKMETVIQKAAELGACEVVPVSSQNCVVKLDEAKALAKRARWQAIARSASEQSKRSRILQVGEWMDFKEALAAAAKLDVRLFPYENERGMAHTREVVRGIKAGQSVGIFIGPEGGFASHEVELARETMEVISLGNRILRTETAGTAALSMLVYELE